MKIAFYALALSLLASIGSALHVNSWQNLAWGQSAGGVDPTSSAAEAVLIDLDSQADLISSLKTDGKIVICYFSAGTYEKFRDYGDDTPLWKSLSLKSHRNFRNEYWLDISRLEDLQTILAPRFNKSKTLGCDAVEPDNVDCFEDSHCRGKLRNKQSRKRNNAAETQIEFNSWLANYSHFLGLEIGLKNAVSLLPDLAEQFDFFVNENCVKYHECDEYEDFSAEKSVFHVEYKITRKNCFEGAKFDFLTKQCKGRDFDCKNKPWENCIEVEEEDDDDDSDEDSDDDDDDDDSDDDDDDKQNLRV